MSATQQRLPLTPRQIDALTLLLKVRLGSDLISELGTDGVKALHEVAGKLDGLKDQR